MEKDRDGGADSSMPGNFTVSGEEQTMMETEQDKTEYIRVMGNDYLVIKGIPCKEPDYQAKMMAGNAVDHFLKCELKQVDGGVEYRYQITSMRTLEESMARTSFAAQDIRKLVESLEQAVRMLGEYLLSEDKILLDPRRIFCRLSDGKLYFCYYPDKEENFSDSMKAFLPYLLKKADHEDRDAIILAYSLYQAGLEERVTVEDLKRTLSSPILGQAAQEKKEEKPRIENRKTEEQNKKTQVDGEGITEHGPQKETQQELQNERSKEKNDGGNGDTDPIKRSSIPPRTASVMSEEPGEKEWMGKARTPGEGVTERGDKTEKKKTSLLRQRLGEILVPLISASVVLAWFGYHSWQGEYPWRENPRLYTGIILLILASNVIYVFGSVLQSLGEKKRIQASFAERNGRQSSYAQESHGSPQEREKQLSVKKSRTGPVTTVVSPEKKRDGKKQTDHGAEMKYALLSCQPDKIPNIPVRHFPFVIGKKTGECDFQILDSTIRKKHAQLDREDETVYITDYSCGFTSVNGHVLEERESMQIVPGQEIRLSDYAFIWVDQNEQIPYRNGPQLQAQQLDASWRV